VCRKCGTLLLELNNHDAPRFIDVTNHWDEIYEWYSGRRTEIEASIEQLETQLLSEVHGVVEAILAGAKTETPTAPRTVKGLTLIKS
jgi:hypothetical protein